MKNVTKKANEFNQFRFEGLSLTEKSNKYLTMNRFNEDETKIVVKIGEEHLKSTQYGYALILDNETVVFLKEWQINSNYYGIECLLTKEYFIPKKWGNWDRFTKNEENCIFENWVKIAKEQQNYQEKDEYGDLYFVNNVYWEK